MLIILLLVFFGCAFLTYNMSIKPMLALMAWLPSLIALWLLKTRRFRGLWKRLCVMRRRRTRYRRLIRQLKRTQALDDLITAFSLEMHSRVTRERAVWPIKQRQVYSRLMRSSPGASEALILEQTKNRRMSGGELLGLYRIHRYMGHQGFHTLRALQVTAGVCLLSSSDRMLDETLTI